MDGDRASESDSAGAAEIVTREDLLWQIRARAGRLQMLMDSASQFYSNCFSSSELDGLAYGVHGEWSSRCQFQPSDGRMLKAAGGARSI